MLTGWTKPSLWHSLVLMLPETKLPGFPFPFIFLFKCWGNARGLKRQRATLQEENSENAGHLCTGDMSFPAYLSPTSPLKSPSALPKEMQPHRGLALVGEKEQLWGPGERTPQAVCGRVPLILYAFPAGAELWKQSAPSTRLRGNS